MRATSRPGPLDASLNFRLTTEQRVRLEKAVPYTPGASTPGGVIRRAIDEYLERILGQSPD